jgi:parvulin-like peptidyl-prolyl isomerase
VTGPSPHLLRPSATGLLLAACLIACAPPNIDDYDPGNQPASGAATPEEAEILLARVDGEPITLGDFERRLSNLSDLAQSRLVGTTARQSLLEAMIAAQLLAGEARRRGLAQDPEVLWAERQAVAEVTLERLARAELEASPVSPAELQAYYEANAFRFDRPPMMWIALLLVADQERAEHLVADYRARVATDVVDSLEAFDRLIEAEAAFTPQPGDLGFVTRARLAEVAADELVEALGPMRNAAEIAGPIRVAGGWAIVQLRERRERLRRPLAEVEQALRDELREARLAQRREELRQRWRARARLGLEAEHVAELAAAHASHRSTASPAPWEAWSPLRLNERLTPAGDLTMLGRSLGPPPEEPTPLEGAGEATDGTDDAIDRAERPPVEEEESE